MARPCFCAWLAVGASSLVAPARRLAPSRGAGLVARAGDPLVEGLSDTESGGPLGVFLSKSNPLYSSVPSSAAPSLIGCSSLAVRGKVIIEAGVCFGGDVEVVNAGANSATLPAGTYINRVVRLPDGVAPAPSLCPLRY